MLLLRRLRRTLTVLAPLLLCACPFFADQPLSDPATASMDAALAGTWKTQDPDRQDFTWQRVGG